MSLYKTCYRYQSGPDFITLDERPRDQVSLVAAVMTARGMDCDDTIPTIRYLGPIKVRLDPYSEEDLLLLIKCLRDGVEMRAYEYDICAAIGVVSDDRHNGSARQAMAEALGVDITGLDSTQAACRILAAQQ